MATPKKIIIEPDSAGQRLDKFLTAEMCVYSRAKIQKLIEGGHITVNGAKTNKHRFLKLNDEIMVRLIRKPAKQSNLKLPKIEIIASTNDYIIVDKPTNLVVHTDSAHPQETTLVGYLLSKYPEIKKIGEDPQRPGIVHRLDKNVSGVMVVARNQNSYWDLKKQFTDRIAKKHYIALVHGIINIEQDILDFPIVRSKSGFMAAAPKGSLGRQSKTIIKVLKKYIKYTLLDITLITGRTHQIKVHLKAYNHPVVGEKLYTNKTLSGEKLQKAMARPFLHSKQLKFHDLRGKLMTFTSPLPKDLQDILKQLK